ncbi:uncharacterized protein LOC125253701 [Megalobrama amblycephala]|uniref:uncharacterized protein LOC125253701 n=1 Tax=Megalobrama amblycephala TaxID=75352 RepID=UPI0020142872|nr:uncharacterized protein LOC125253701 [Megalobrama amblycephala]
MPGKWTEKTGLDLQGFPGQPYGNDCGVFMLMSAFYMVMDSSFDYTILDMPELRKWWCVMLMENYGLDSHGKVFAHFTEESKALLSGDWQPAFRLRKRKLEDTCQEEPQHLVQESSSQADDASINVLHPVMEDALLESSQENQLMRDLKEASKWCSEQSSVLLGSVQLPKVLYMEDEDFDEAMDKLQKAPFSEDRIDALEPFCFIFTEKEDMIFFLDHVVDVMNLKVFCQTETKENT